MQSHSLPDLTYDYNALEPFIDEETMRIHHTKHHSGYVEKLNKALESLPDFSELDIETLLSRITQIPESSRQAIINNGGGHANHTLFWKILGPKDNVKPSPEGKLLKGIEEQFSSFDEFKKLFNEKSASLFGSGWVFLVKDADNKLQIKRHSFQNSPLMSGNTPILGLDVWEHAYYLKYQNRRAEYIEAFWNIVNWNEVEKLYE